MTEAQWMFVTLLYAVALIVSLAGAIGCTFNPYAEPKAAMRGVLFNLAVFAVVCALTYAHLGQVVQR